MTVTENAKQDVEAVSVPVDPPFKPGTYTIRKTTDAALVPLEAQVRIKGTDNGFTVEIEPARGHKKWGPRPLQVEGNRGKADQKDSRGKIVEFVELVEANLPESGSSYMYGIFVTYPERAEGGDPRARGMGEPEEVAVWGAEAPPREGDGGR